MMIPTGEVLEAATKLGEAIAKSNMFGCQNIAQGIVIACHCLQSGIPLLEWQARYHLIAGKPTMKAEAMLAAFIEELDGNEHEWIRDGKDGELAELKLTRKGRSVTYSFSMDEARTAGLVKADSGWTKNPANMLRARTISNCLTMIAPHLKMGVYTPEEVEDFTGQTPENNGPVDLSAPIEQPKRGRGRPPKSDAGTEQATPPTEVVTPTAATETTVTEEQTAKQERAEAAKGFANAVANVVTEVVKQATEQAAPNVATPEQMQEISRLHGVLSLGDRPEVWAGVLEKLDCPKDADGKRKIKLATPKQANDLIAWMGKQVDRLQVANQKKTAEEWAEGGVAAKA